MGVGSLLCMHFALVRKVSPEQPRVHHLLGLGQPTQLTLGQPVYAVLVGS